MSGKARGEGPNTYGGIIFGPGIEVTPQSPEVHGYDGGPGDLTRATRTPGGRHGGGEPTEVEKILSEYQDEYNAGRGGRGVPGRHHNGPGQGYQGQALRDS